MPQKLINWKYGIDYRIQESCGEFRTQVRDRTPFIPHWRTLGHTTYPTDWEAVHYSTFEKAQDAAFEYLDRQYHESRSSWNTLSENAS